MAVVPAFGNLNKIPGFKTNNTFTPGLELLASFHRFTQKGGTLKANAATDAGNGVLLSGTPLAKDSGTKKYIPVVSTDTTNKIVGFLRDTCDTTLGDLGCNIVRAGILNNKAIKAAVAALDATTAGLVTAQVTQLNGRVDADDDTFTF